MTATLRVSLLLARRNLANVVRIPGNVITVVGLPVLVLVMFAGAFAGLTGRPGFPTRDPLDWVLPYAVAMGALFAGLGSAFNVQRDLAGGFADRLVVSPGTRAGLLLGEVAGSIGRAWLQLVAVAAIGLLAGMPVPGGPLAWLAVALGSAGLATWSGLWALALMYRLRSAQALGLVAAGVAALGLLSTGQVPLADQSGWLSAVARINPVTPVLALSRQGLIGTVGWHDTWPGLLTIAVVSLVLAVPATTGLRRLTL